MPIYIQGLKSERAGTPIQRLMGRVLAVVAGAGVLLLALMFSLVFFAIALTAALIIGGRIWWKTRSLRRQYGQQSFTQANARTGGRVIEGEVLNKED